MNNLTIILLASLLLAACTDEDVAMRALESAGYTNIELTGYRAFMCGEGDNFATGFSAIGPTGRHTTGAVCSGWLKGATIRTD